MASFIPADMCRKISTVEGRKELMRQYPGIWSGKNEDNESVLVVVARSGIKLSTNQANGWVRVNYYDSEGLPSGETFDGKWNEHKNVEVSK